MKQFPFKYTDDCRNRARPLSLKEVLQLRNGMKVFNNQPYQIKKIAYNKKILLALN
jgi:hypothetical protein